METTQLRSVQGIIRFGLPFLLLFMLLACGNNVPAASTQPTAAVAPSVESASGKRLTVIATYSILGDLVKQVGGEQIDLKVLVGPNGDPHTFEPVPADGAMLAQAAVVFENGLAFEPWLDDLYTAAGSKATRVVVTDGITPISLEEEEHAEGAEEEHEHGEFDPHVWHDVNNAMVMVDHIRDALVAADPDHATIYQQQAASYRASLEELNQFIKEQVEQLPAERRKLVTSHDTFQYFAKAYGFEIVGTALGVTTEASDPSAQQIATLVEEIKQAGVPAIFVENTSNQKLMDTIAAEAGVRVAPPLYTDALGEAGSTGATYVEMERYNIATIVQALQG